MWWFVLWICVVSSAFLDSQNDLGIFERHFRCQSSKVHQTSNRRCICSQALLRSSLDAGFDRFSVKLKAFPKGQCWTDCWKCMKLFEENIYSIHLDADLLFREMWNVLKCHKMSWFFTTLAYPPSAIFRHLQPFGPSASFRQLLGGDLFRCNDLLADSGRKFWGSWKMVSFP